MRKRRICTKNCGWREFVGKAEFLGKQTEVARTRGTSTQLLTTLKAEYFHSGAYISCPSSQGLFCRLGKVNLRPGSCSPWGWKGEPPPGCISYEVRGCHEAIFSQLPVLWLEKQCTTICFSTSSITQELNFDRRQREFNSLCSAVPHHPSPCLSLCAFPDFDPSSCTKGLSVLLHLII